MVTARWPVFERLEFNFVAKQTHPRVSIIVPTRERVEYLPHCLSTCLANPDLDFEVLVLDNASTDGTQAMIGAMSDARLRYVRSEVRLSMRDNFERGLDLARGEVIGFIGDDDGVLPFTVARVNAIMADPQVDAVAAKRIHYGWPDLLAGRANIALVPRGRGVKRLQSRAMLRSLLDDNDYYKLPCLYHGFVRRAAIERVRARQDRFFLSSQVDMFSTIALSNEDLTYALAEDPLVINGGSSRSNGASQFGGGGTTEKTLWKQEDDLGFLPGFENCLSVGALIVESASRFCAATPGATVTDLLGRERVLRAIAHELALRAFKGRADAGREAAGQMTMAAGIGSEATPIAKRAGPFAAFIGRASAFGRVMPLMADRHGVSNVAEVSTLIADLLARHHTGLTYRPAEQIAAALKLGRGR